MRKSANFGDPSQQSLICSARGRPPTQSATYCVAHDDGIWERAEGLLNGVPSDAEPEVKQLSSLPMRLGGLGLRSAERCAPAAYWASWADAIQMIGQRTPEVAAQGGAEDGTTGTFAWVFGGFAGGLDTSGQARVLVAPKLGGIARWQATTRTRRARSRRVATRLAVLGFLHP